jgi:hypothetical protein
MRRLDIQAPFQPAVSVTLTHDTTVDRAGAISACTSTRASLSCKAP